MKKLIEVERISYGNVQYARKGTIELHGFHPNIPDTGIESKVLKIINEIKDKDQTT